MFENTIISLSNPHSFYIYSTIILQEPIPSNTLFDLDIGVHTDQFADYPVEVQFVEPGSTVVGNAVVDIVDNRIAVNSLQFDYDITKIYLKFTVTYPTWTQVQTVYDFTIDGVTYECEKNQTWSAWCLSSYNTLGLYVEDGKIYYEVGRILKTGDTTVLSSDYVDKDLSYYLDTSSPAVTYIDFYIGNNQCTAVSGMTFEAWVNSEYNTLSLIIDGDNIYSNDKSTILQSGGVDIGKTTVIVSGAYYSLVTVLNELQMKINGINYTFIEGMTWDEWINSAYNIDGFYIKEYNSNFYVYTSSNNRIYYINKFINDTSGDINYSGPFSVTSSLIIKPIISRDAFYPLGNDYMNYGIKSYCDDIKAGNILPENEVNTIVYSRYQYEFDFSITSVEVTVQNDNRLLNGIIAWLKKIKDSISNLASEIASTIGSKLEYLFVPNDARILEIKEEFEQELKGRFGVLFDAVDIVDMVAGTFVYKGTNTTITLPSVTVDLAGTPFTFGGYEVDVIPDGFEGLVDALRLVVNITCTWWFVLSMKKRLEEVLSK